MEDNNKTKQEELRETMRRLKFPNGAILEPDPTSPAHRASTTQLGMSPSELKNKYAYTSRPTDKIAFVPDDGWYPGRQD